MFKFLACALLAFTGIDVREPQGYFFIVPEALENVSFPPDNIERAISGSGVNRIDPSEDIFSGGRNIEIDGRWDTMFAHIRRFQSYPSEAHPFARTLIIHRYKPTEELSVTRFKVQGHLSDIDETDMDKIRWNRYRYISDADGFNMIFLDFGHCCDRLGYGDHDEV